MSSVIRCPVCKALVSVRFPLHECKVPLSSIKSIPEAEGLERIHLSGAPHRRKKRKDP